MMDPVQPESEQPALLLSVTTAWRRLIESIVYSTPTASLPFLITNPAVFMGFGQMSGGARTRRLRGTGDDARLQRQLSKVEVRHSSNHPRSSSSFRSPLLAA